MIHFFKKSLIHIQNPIWFFIGVVLLILGSFIIIFDYPQIRYFENIGQEMFATLEFEQKELYNRLKIEFSIGIVILFAGSAMFVVSLFKNFMN
tara:strand:- start:106 stop:384 length:279 start_codon:yes stop_codon:yes gene_type:complete